MVRTGSSQKTDKNMDLCVSNKKRKKRSDVITQNYDKNTNMNTKF